ncbi:MAG: glycosyltransferase family 2 protein [Chlorogloeopsis fritschii C42_A2020_084]|uniref:glycosyltransferase family 2 protein n=1 Tax=Chlorogloeopsis fritschii TaxID=1124 RepID=UPI0019E3C4D4|nr:glycosyltransferase [Chlorogloeopsis fritschii]MBF2004720.1 glycosyltransferase family 2 protein [Chlorogloeopsis fritschii C42_A2020_084]
MKVSVIISNYNYARYLPTAIDSVLTQTYPNFEIIIVDDGSKDNSREVIAQLEQTAPDKIKAIYQPNQGQGAAFNTGFEAASGDVIAFLDADDVWQPQKLQRIVEEFNRSDVIGVMHLLNNIDGNGNVVNGGSTVGQLLDDNLAQVIVDTGNAWCFPPTSGLAYRRKALEKIFPIDCSKWRLCADGCLIYCTAFLGKVKTLNEVLGSYRIHGANHYINHSTNKSEEAQALAGIEMTNRYINEFLEQIGHPYRVNLSRNLQYRRTNYYRRGKWNTKEVIAISNLILGWRFYSLWERIYYLMRFWMKSIRLLAHPDVSVNETAA